jgi:hypothetical protein
MSKTHFFVASGDACPVCQSLAGQPVDPGYRPHDNCNCNTIARKKGGKCRFEYSENRLFRERGRLRIEMSLKLTCPDGSVIDDRTFTTDLAFVLDGSEDADMEAWAQEACDEDCEDDGSDDGDEFLCC